MLNNDIQNDPVLSEIFALGCDRYLEKNAVWGKAMSWLGKSKLGQSTGGKVAGKTLKPLAQGYGKLYNKQKGALGKGGLLVGTGFLADQTLSTAGHITRGSSPYARSVKRTHMKTNTNQPYKLRG